MGHIFTFANGDWTISSNKKENDIRSDEDGCFHLNMSLISNKILTDCLSFKFERQIPVPPCRICVPLENVESHTHIYQLVWKLIFSSNVFPWGSRNFEFHRAAKPSRLLFSASFVCEKETPGKIRWNICLHIYISVCLSVFKLSFLPYISLFFIPLLIYFPTYVLFLFYIKCFYLSLLPPFVPSLLLSLPFLFSFLTPLSDSSFKSFLPSLYSPVPSPFIHELNTCIIQLLGCINFHLPLDSNYSDFINYCEILSDPSE